MAARGARSAAIQIGNLPGARTVSAKASLDAAANRLRLADEEGDPNEMLAALAAATSLDLPDGVSMTPQLQARTAAMRQRVSAEPELAELDAIRRSPALKGIVRRLWDLIVSESWQIEIAEGKQPKREPGEEDQVTRAGYMVFHMLVGKALIAAGEWNRADASAISDSDWAEDIAKFSGTSVRPNNPPWPAPGWQRAQRLNGARRAILSAHHGVAGRDPQQVQGGRGAGRRAPRLHGPLRAL